MSVFTPKWLPSPAAEQYHQGALLRKALDERGRTDGIAIDHMGGRNLIGGKVERGIVYPDSFFDLTAALVAGLKPVRFLFIGYVPVGRETMLAAFAARNPGTLVIPTDTGRWKALKGEYDAEYYAHLGSARFGLCPHHPDWRGPWETMWTYRFIECCLVGAIPVTFRATPLAPAFTDGFRFVWDDDAEFTYNPDDARHNRALAEEHFRL